MLLFISSFSEAERIEAFLNPTLTTSENIVSKQKPDVLKALLAHGTMYTTELSRETSLHIDTVNKILSSLLKDKLIARFNPDHYNPQPPIKHRIAYLQSVGMASYEQVCRASWWIITPTGVNYVKNSCKGEGVQIHKSIVEHYNFFVDGVRYDTMKKRGVV